MNSKIKIDTHKWWRDVNGGPSRRIPRQFFNKEDYENFEFTSNDPDFTIVFGRTDWSQIKTPKERTFYFSQEPLFSRNEPKDEIHNYCSRIFIADKSAYPDRNEYIEVLMPMFYAGRDEASKNPNHNWSYLNKDIHYEKSKNTSMVVSKILLDHFPSTDSCKIIYKLRVSLAQKLADTYGVDVFGARWEPDGKHMKGHIETKHSALDEYRFSVACENSIQKNYISEKFWDPIITETVPIYLGCKNIKNYIPEDSFINLPTDSIDEMTNAIKEVINNHESLYKKYRPKILDLKKDFYSNPKFNLWQKIKLEIKDS